MLHHQLSDGNEYGVGYSGANGKVLLQLNDTCDGEQVRVSLTQEEAEELIGALTEALFKVTAEQFAKVKVVAGGTVLINKKGTT